MSRVVLSAASRIGNVRKNNEDMILAYNKLLRSDVYQTEFMTENNYDFVVALADGMGGHRAGEIASQLTLENLKYYVSDLPRGLKVNGVQEYMERWLQSVHQMVNAHGYENKEMRDMGTTMVGILYYNGRYFWMNCGDSRLYRWREGFLEQMTVDHSLNVLRGETKHSNIITNCIGAGAPSLYMDMVEFTDNVKTGDKYVLCSDGLNDMVSHEDIQQLLTDGASANMLCEAAIERGGFDNVSVVVLQLTE